MRTLYALLGLGAVMLWALSARAELVHHQLLANNPEASSIEIRNPSLSEHSVFRIVSLNGTSMLQTENEVIDGVLATPAEYPDYSTTTKIFRFIISNRYHDFGLSLSMDWVLSPTLFFNSGGYSLCGETADMYADLATMLNYPVRIWSLEGHVAVEAYSDGKWKFYDPDYGVFFLNRNAEIASLEELAADPDLIVNPIYLMDFPLTEVGTPYSWGYANLLATTEDNWIGENWGPPIPAQEVVFDLPPGAWLQLGNVYAPAPTNWSDLKVPRYRNLKISYPKGFTGTLSHFLVLHDIQGQGVVKIDGEEFQAGSQELFDFIDSRSAYFHEIEIVSSDDRIDVIYLLNPMRWTLGAENHLMLDRVSGPAPRPRITQLPVEVDALAPDARVLLAGLLLVLGGAAARRTQRARA